MDTCIFCKIIAGEIPNYTVYEDDTFLAFLDIHPHTKGQVLIIPKTHYRRVWDYPEIGSYFEIAQKIVSAQQKALNTDFVIGLQVGEDVAHAHIKLIPRHTDDGHGKFITQDLYQTYTPEEMNVIAETIKKELL